jgi:N-acetylmuramoyl-L-alanine amidase
MAGQYRRMVAAFALWLCVPTFAQQRFATVKEVRHWSSGEIARVSIELSGEVAYDFDRLQSPDRIYIDIADSRLANGRKALHIPVNNGIIRRIRGALTTPTVTRVVLDLDTDVEFSVGQLANPDRIVVELRARTEIKAPPQPVEVTESAPPPPRRPALRAFRAPRLEPQPVPRPTRRVIDPLDVPPLSATGPSVPPRLVRFPEPSVRPPVIVRADAAPPPPAPARAPVDAVVNRSLTRVLGLKLNRVVLDAGHGGIDHGTTSPGGLVEKELVLDVTLRLGKLLTSRLGVEVLHTRTDDRFVSLDARGELANAQQADLFLSIHANSSPYRPAFGTETYYLSLSNDPGDRSVAARENAGSGKSVHELGDLVQKIARYEKATESRDFAARIQTAAHDLVVKTHGRAYNRGVKKAPFVVLIGTQMPAVLVEIGFLTNPREEDLMRKPDYRQRLAEALCRGVMHYAESLNSHRGVAGGGE